MTAAVKTILDSFEQLSDRERRDVVAEIYRRAGRIETPPLSEEDLIANAAERFRDFDAWEEESANDRS